MKIWHHQISEAHTWQALLSAAREYIASLSPQEWASIPEKCRPRRIKGIDDLDYWHQRLAEEYLDRAVASKASDVHREMLAFFTAAADRASEICGNASPHDEDAVSDVSTGQPPGIERRRERRS